MDKRISPNDKVKSRKIDADSADKKLAKIKQALQGVNWNYDSLFEDLNGFIEDHQQNTNKLKIVENEKATLTTELAQTEQRLQFLEKKLNENQNELQRVKFGYQKRIDELLNVKKELNTKIDALTKIKVNIEEQFKNSQQLLKTKELELTQALNLVSAKDQEIVQINKDYSQKFVALKAQMLEKVEEKQKLITAKSTRLSAEKEHLQKYISELMADNSKINQEFQNLKKQILELTHQKEALVSQKLVLEQNMVLKNEHTKELNDQIEVLRIQARDINKILEQKNIELNTMAGQISERNTIVDKLKDNKNILEKINQNLNLELTKKNQEISNLNIKILNLINENNDLKFLNEQRTELEEQLTIKQADFHRLQNENVDLQDQISQKEFQIDDLKVKYENLKIDNDLILKKFDELSFEKEKSIEQLKLQKSELQESFNAITKQLNESNQIVLQKNEEINYSKDKVNALEQDLTQKIKNINLINTEILENKDKIKALHSELVALKQVIAEYKQKNVDKANEIHALESDLEYFKPYKLQLEAKEEELAGKILQFQKLNEERNKTLSSLAEADKEIASLKIQNENLSFKIDNLEDEIRNQDSQYLKEVGELKGKINDQIIQFKDSQEENQNFILEKNNIIKNLELKVSEHEMNESLLQQKIIDLNHEIHNINDLKTLVEESNENLKENVSSLNIKKNELQLEIIEYKKSLGLNAQAMQDLNQAIDDEKQNVLDLRSEIKDKDDEIALKLLMINDIIEERKQGLAQIDDLNQKIVELNQTIENKNNENLIIVNEKNTFATKLGQLKNQNFELDTKIDKLNGQVFKLSKDLESAQQLATDFESEIQSRDLIITNLENSHIQFSQEAEESKQVLFSQIVDLKSVISNLEAKQVQSSDDILKLNSEVEMLIEKLEQKAKLTSDLQALIDEKDTTLNAKSNQVFTLEGEKLELVQKIQNLETKAADIGLKIIQAGEMYEEAFSHKQKLEAYIDEKKELYQKLDKRNKELDIAFASLEKREVQLSLYSRWVDAQKEGLQKQVLRIASELRSTKEFNPLNPYLKMTEKELSKIEILLTKSNVFGPQRAHLESQYEQLIKQRDEVRELLVRTNTEVDQKALTLIAVLKSSEFIPVPPLPPGKVDQGDTEILDF